MDLTAALLAVSAAVSFGLAVFVQKKALSYTDDLTGTFISLGTNAALFWVLAPLFIEWHWWATGAALLFALCGLAFPAIGQELQIASVVHVGPSVTSAIGSFAPVFAVLPAVLFLGERLNLQATLGLAIMTAALLYSALEPKGIRRNWSTAALLLPLGAAFVRGIIQPLSKTGYEQVPSPFFATLVMATVSTVVIGLFVLAAPRRPAGRHAAKGRAWFVLNGVVIGLGILAMLAAIRLGDIILVAPLISTTPLWTLLLGVVFFRRERFGRRDALMATLVVLGAVLIVTR